MALPGWTLGGYALAVPDDMNADILRDTSSKQYAALVEIFGPLVAAAMVANPAVADELIAQAGAAVADTISGYFQPGTQSGLVTFPNGSEPGIAFGVRYGIDPTAIPAGTASFHGLPTTSGTGTISVRTPNGSGGTWGNSLTPGFQRPTAGSAIVLAVTAVGAGDGVSRVRVAALPDAGGQAAMGGIVAAKFDSNDVKFLRWFTGSTGRYGISRWNGTSLSAGSFETLLSTNVVQQAGDLVDFSLERSTGYISLKVNGALIGLVKLDAAKLAGHSNATYAGVWANGTLGAGAKLGTWHWLAEYSTGTGTVNRQIPSVGADLRLPSSLLLDPQQKRQVAGMVFDPRDFGAKVDGILLTDVTTYAGQNYVQSATYTFTTADIGKRVAVMGAGPVVANANDGVWIGTIKDIDGASARLDTIATSSATGLRAKFGTVDDLAYAKAQDEAGKVAAFAVNGGTVLIPRGISIVTSPLLVQDYVSWIGRGRDQSWVHVIQDSSGDANVAGTSDWLTCAGRTAATPLVGARFEDFGIEAEAHVHTLGYGAGIKPLNIYHVKRVSIQRMNVWNTPATAIPFDHSQEMCVIRDNYILNPGRIAPVGAGPGGSGIGAGTRGVGDFQPTLIEGNVIIGRHTATSAVSGHNGIFTEAQTGANPDTPTVGYRIVNNVVIGMYFGISDTGSSGTIISGNQIFGCARGIRLSNTTLPGSYSGLNTTISNNVIMFCTGPGANDGIGISILTSEFANVREYLHTLVTGNQITDNKLWGISINASNKNLTGVMVHDNQILRNGRSGVRVVAGNGSPVARIRQLSIKDNTIANNGRSLVAGDQAAVLVTPGTIWEGGYLQSRRGIYDSTVTPFAPTQVDTVITTGATLINVEKDPVPVLW